jgi:hypothetical protein
LASFWGFGWGRIKSKLETPSGKEWERARRKKKKKKNSPFPTPLFFLQFWEAGAYISIATTITAN